MSNVIELGNRGGSTTDDNTPEYFIYEITLKPLGDNVSAVLSDYGYLVPFGPIIGVVRGPRGEGEFSTVVNTEDVYHIVNKGPATKTALN